MRFDNHTKNTGMMVHSYKYVAHRITDDIRNTEAITRKGSFSKAFQMVLLNENSRAPIYDEEM